MEIGETKKGAETRRELERIEREENKDDTLGIENYYIYIVEQLEYVEMITSTFDVRRKVNPIISREVAKKCNQLADMIQRNLEGI